VEGNKEANILRERMKNKKDQANIDPAHNYLPAAPLPPLPTEEESPARRLDFETAISTDAATAEVTGVSEEVEGGGLDGAALVEGAATDPGSYIASVPLPVVDAFWPPSYPPYTIPMKVRGSTRMVAALSFGKSSQKRSAPPAASGFSRKTKRLKKPAVDSTVVSNDAAAGTTNLERKWNRHARLVRQTFNGLREELFKAKQAPSTALVPQTKSVNQTRKVATFLFRSVTNDISTMCSSAKVAKQCVIAGIEDKLEAPVEGLKEHENAATKPKRDGETQELDEEEKSLLLCTEEIASEGEQEEDKEEPDDEERLALLVCAEEIETKTAPKTLSKEASRKLAIQMAQDVALIRELTFSIRRKTLDLCKTRIAKTTQ
jgi:hypothetical protein